MAGAASQAARKRPSTRRRGAIARVELTPRRIPALSRAALGSDSRSARTITDNATHDGLRSQEPCRRRAGRPMPRARSGHRRGAVAGRRDARRAAADTGLERLGLLRRRCARTALLQPRPDQPRQRCAARASLDLPYRRARCGICQCRQAHVRSNARACLWAPLPRDRDQCRDRARPGVRPRALALRSAHRSCAPLRAGERARRERVGGERARGRRPPSAVFGKLVIVGSAIGDNRAADVERGVIRAYDAQSGAPLWSFDPLPDSASHPAAADWNLAQAQSTGAGNSWGMMSVDHEHGLVLVPTGSASPDYYGGQRLGTNRFANSLLALDARSGRLVWQQQLIHHDLWGYDLAAQPVLGDVEVQGMPLPVVIQATKTGMLYVFDRAHGQPVFPITERRVPPSQVAGEQ